MKKYPLSLFFIGFMMNVILKHFMLFAASLILLLLGIAVPTCRYVGAIVLMLDFVLSFADQLIIRHTTLNSDNSDFQKWQDAMLSDNWQENIEDLLEQEIKNNPDSEPSDNESDSDNSEN